MKINFYLIKIILFLGKIVSEYIYITGKSFIFIFKLLFLKINFRKDFYIFLKQFYFIGVLSVWLIIISALFIGMVVGLQGFFIIKKFGSVDIVGQMVSLTIVRELSPVITAILFTGRTGSALTAEICLMKSSEQILSMEMMGVNTLRKLMVPRFWCGLYSILFLNVIFIVVSIFGSFLSVVWYCDIDTYVFWESIKNNLNFKIDVLNSFIKSFIFGFIIMWISIFQGVNSDSTLEGIARATTNTVVYSIFFVLCFNFCLTYFMFSWN